MFLVCYIYIGRSQACSLLDAPGRFAIHLSHQRRQPCRNRSLPADDVSTRRGNICKWSKIANMIRIGSHCAQALCGGCLSFWFPDPITFPVSICFPNGLPYFPFLFPLIFHIFPMFSPCFLYVKTDPEAKMGAIPLLIDVVNDTERVAPAARRLGRQGSGGRWVRIHRGYWGSTYGI